MQTAPFRQLPGDRLRPAQAYWVQTEDGLRIRVAHWRAQGDPRGTVLLCPGRTEYIEKYAESADRLTAAGYEVISLDWRGQGLSARLQDDPRPGHIDSFAQYQHDLVEMVVAATELDLPRPWHLLAHSMGGCITLAGLHAGLEVSSAVFSAPMWGINLGRMPQGFAIGLAYLAGRVGRGGRAVFGKGGTYTLDESFSANLLTEDPGQWSRMLCEDAAWPDMTISGASFTWVKEALNECSRLSQLDAPNVPALVSLGSEEKVVSARAIRDRVASWPGAELLEIDGARHEVMMCLPERRAAFFDAALAHFARHSDR